MATNLKLENFSDREVLHLVNDNTAAAGWATARDIGLSMGLSRDGMSAREYEIHVTRCVGTRLGWIGRLTGCVEQNPEKHGQWRLTGLGQRMISNEMNKQLRESLVGMNDVDAVMATSLLGRHFQRSGANGANLMRREWAYGTHRKRREG